MIRRLTLLFLEFVAGITAGVVILVLAGAWWLSSGPVSLAFLTPYVEEALSPQDSTLAVQVDDTVVIWAGWERAVDVRVMNIKVLNLDGRVVAAMPQVSLGFSLQAMLHGLIAPTYIEIPGARLFVVRGEDGNFSIGFKAGQDSAGEEKVSEDVILSSLIDELSSKADETRSLGYLKRVGIVNANLVLTDKKLGRTWRAPRADIALSRDDEGISAEVALNLDLDGQRSRIAGAGRYLNESRAIEADISFSDIDPVAFLPESLPPRFQRILEQGQKVSGDLTFAMTADGVMQRVGFDIAGSLGRFDGDMTFDDDGYGVAAKISFDGLRWPRIAAASPALADFLRTDLPVAGSVSLLGTADGRVLSMEFDMNSGAGKLVLPKLYDQPVDISGIRVRGAAADNFKRITISDATLKLPRGIVVAKAVATRLAGEWSLRVDTKVSGIAAQSLPVYWPEKAGVDARKWVLLNIKEGLVNDATLSLVARISEGENARFGIESLHGGITVQDASVDYLYPMPKATDVSADMTFTENRFDIAIGSGRSGDLSIDAGTVAITKLDTEDPEIAIDLTIRGPLQTALKLIDHKPLELLGEIGLDATSITGRSAARLVLEFPLLKDLRTDQIAVAVGATLLDVSVDNGPMGLDVRDGSLNLQVTGLGIAADGTVSLNGVPVTVDWQEHFTRTEKLQRQVKVSGLADNAARRALKLPELPFLDGDVPTDVVYAKPFGKPVEVMISADMAAATLDFPQIHWRKPAGTPGTMSLFAILPENGSATVEELRFETADMRVNARIEPTEDMAGIRVLEFRNLDFAGNLLRGRVRFAEDGGLDVNLAGAKAVITPFIRSDDEVDETRTSSAPPIRIKAHIGEVEFGDGQNLRDVVATISGDGRYWQTVNIDAAVDGNSRLAAAYAPDGQGSTLRVTTRNAGDTLRSLGLTERITGGSLEILGRRSAPGAPVTGTFSLKNFKAVKAPALARVLQVLSLTGIFTALNQQGLDFATLDGQFRYFGGALEVRNTRALGSSIGVTTEGFIFVDTDTVRLSGTVMPANTLNRLPGLIPILGTLLTGGKNEGLFAANFAMRGSLEDPQVSVNPLSALAPGILRTLVGSDVKPLPKEDRQAVSQ